MTGYITVTLKEEAPFPIPSPEAPLKPPPTSNPPKGTTQIAGTAYHAEEAPHMMGGDSDQEGTIKGIMDDFADEYACKVVEEPQSPT